MWTTTFHFIGVGIALERIRAFSMTKCKERGTGRFWTTAQLSALITNTDACIGINVPLMVLSALTIVFSKEVFTILYRLTAFVTTGAALARNRSQGRLELESVATFSAISFEQCTGMLFTAQALTSDVIIAMQLADCRFQVGSNRTAATFA
jgi:hypothetical protein